MIHSMLIAVDGSPASLGAARLAAGLARTLGAALRGLHVIDVRLLEGPLIADLVGAMGLGTIEGRKSRVRQVLDARAEAALAALSQVATEEGMDIETACVEGLPDQEIARAAHAVDLVAIGRRGDNADLRPQGLGSTADGVLRRAPTHVLLAGTEKTRVSRPLVAYDASAQAHRALALATALGEQLDLEVIVVTIADRETEGEEILRPAVAYLEATRVSFEAHIRGPGDVARGVVEAVADYSADLLILGATGRSQFVRHLLGSVTERVLEGVDLPIVAVR